MPRIETRTPGLVGGGNWTDLAAVAANEAIPTAGDGVATEGRHVLNFGAGALAVGTIGYDLDVWVRTKVVAPNVAKWLRLARFAAQDTAMCDELEVGEYDRFKLRIYSLAGAGPHSVTPCYLLR